VRAFTFPGQGSQFVGMGKQLAVRFAEARAVFAEIDDALGKRLSRLMFEGPEAELTLTANAQPALMAVSMALLRVMEARGFSLKHHVAYVAGHSLGEYSALCAASMFTISDTARLLRIRGQAMQQAVPVGKGGMAAIIGLDEAVLAELCDGVAQLGCCQIANDNGGGQLVISGTKAAVAQVGGLAAEKGARRVVHLPVSAPFHSALMQPAAERMQEALAQVRCQNPVVALIANVRAEPVDNADDIIDLLVAQVTGRVRWREVVDWLGKNGVSEICEVGAGRVLSGLARRIDKGLKATSIETEHDIEAFLASCENLREGDHV